MYRYREDPNKKQDHPIRLKTWIPVFIAMAGFTWAILTGVVAYLNKTASVDLVETRYKSALNYTDTRISETVREVESYSDKNRLLMEKSLESQTALIREQGKSVENIDKWLQRLSERVDDFSDPRMSMNRRHR